MSLAKTYPLKVALACAALAAGALSLWARPAPRRHGDGDTYTVPFKMLPSNHMVVEAKLNGKGPYRFIFDLGAPVTLLSNKVAEATGAIDKGAPRSFLMSTRGEGKVKELAFGDLKADDVPVIVMDHPALKALGGIFSRPIEGIIGYTFWARYRMTIDYQAREMTFTPVDFEVRNLLEDLPNRLMGPKAAKTLVLAPRGVWGLVVGEPEGGVSARGVPITAVVPGSPAEAAGLEVGDVITTLDGRWTASVADAYAAALGVEPGREADVVLLRDGEEMTLKVTPREGL
jgi:membrane-associated protease RseP (regulator of RpoE activity)